MSNPIPTGKQRPTEEMEMRVLVVEDEQKVANLDGLAKIPHVGCCVK
jgi:hypothetical protein